LGKRIGIQTLSSIYGQMGKSTRTDLDGC